MHSIKEIQLKCNKQFVVNFDGGELSSDGGLLMIKEFLHALGFEKLLKNSFKTNDTAMFRIHTDDKNLLQMIYQILGTYYEDNCADELRKDPILTALLGKEALASQPTISRFFNRMDDTTLRQFDLIMRELRRKVYSICRPEFILFDLDTTLLATYGKQEGEGFNYHYQAHGYHPSLCYDGLTGDLISARLRNGTDYCSKDSAEFMKPVITEYRENYPDIQLYARADSGFAAPELYDLFEDNDVKYAIRLKANPKLTALASEEDASLTRATKHNMLDYAVVYGEFTYQASSWRSPRRVVFKIEKPANHNIFNWFRRLALPKEMGKNLIDTVRLKLLKVAVKVDHTGRYVKFKLCSSCPCKREVFATFENIWNIAVQLE